MAQRRPPYDLKYIHEGEWGSNTCWGGEQWNKEEVAAFSEPTATKPLTLLINNDAECLAVFRETLARPPRKLDENTVKDRVNRYTTHIAFHLYQMYLFQKARRDEHDRDSEARIPEDDDMRKEIARVAGTLLQLMEVAVR
jgi:hypothetical protein